MIWLSLLVCLVGLVVLAVATDAKKSVAIEAGKIMFAVGLLVYLLCTCHATRLLP
jgi:hypothetical protein